MVAKNSSHINIITCENSIHIKKRQQYVIENNESSIKLNDSKQQNCLSKKEYLYIHKNNNWIVQMYRTDILIYFIRLLC